MSEVEQNLPNVPEEDRPDVLWCMGLSLVEDGELDWAERIAAGTEYCAENAEVLLRVANARADRGERDRAIEIARAIARLALRGDGQMGNRALDLKDIGKLLFGLDDENEAVQHLNEAIRLALICQSAHDEAGFECLEAVAALHAKRGNLALAREIVDQISHPARREDALRRIEEAADV